MTWGKRVLLAVLIICGALYAVLAIAERSKEPIRKGLQDYLQQATGGDAEITDIITVKLVPDIVFRVKGIVVRDFETRKKSLMKIDLAYISMPFHHLVFGINDYLGFEVRGAEFATGFMLPKKLDLDFAGISDISSESTFPHFVIEGRYNGKPLLITADMQRKERKKGALYKFANIFPVTAKIGELEGSGYYDRGWNRIDFKEMVFVRGADTAKFTVEDFNRDPLSGDVKGTVNDIPFTGTLMEQEGKGTLIVKTENVEEQDFKVIARFLDNLRQDLGLSEENPEFKIEFESIPKERDEE